MNYMPEELIILGNGFDLACGLKSSYKSFFKYYLKKYYNINYKDNENLIFNDSESGKLKILPRLKYEERNIINKSQSIFLYDDYKNVWGSIFLLEFANKIHDKDWSDIERKIAEALLYIFYNEESSNLSLLTKSFLKPLRTQKNLSSSLLKQLKNFESDFSFYIKHQKNEKYLSTARNKLCKLIDNNPRFYADVLSFNYSLGRFDNKVSDIQTRIKKWINIHGFVGSDVQPGSPIIFGIDPKLAKKKSKLIPFTKAYRRLVNNLQFNELPSHIDKLVFYGHSLSEADYSYFEAIFDIYNLYNSNIWLQFYYGAYDIKEEEKNMKLRSKQVENIYKLFNHYGKSLQENHGDNLFSLLTLEGRIIITPDYTARG